MIGLTTLEGLVTKLVPCYHHDGATSLPLLSLLGLHLAISWPLASSHIALLLAGENLDFQILAAHSPSCLVALKNVLVRNGKGKL